MTCAGSDEAAGHAPCRVRRVERRPDPHRLALPGRRLRACVRAARRPRRRGRGVLQPETPPPCALTRTCNPDDWRARARRLAPRSPGRVRRRSGLGTTVRRAQVGTWRAVVEGGAVRRLRCGDGAARAVEEETARPWSSGDSPARSPGSRRVRVTRAPDGTPWGPPRPGRAGANRRSADLQRLASQTRRHGARAPCLRSFPRARTGAPATGTPQASAEARRRSCRRSSSFMWILHTRDSLRPSSSPISRSDRSSQYFR